MAWMERLHNVFRRQDVNPEIDEEIQFHIDERIRENIAAGLSMDSCRS